MESARTEVLSLHFVPTEADNVEQTEWRCKALELKLHAVDMNGLHGWMNAFIFPWKWGGGSGAFKTGQYYTK